MNTEETATAELELTDTFQIEGKASNKKRKITTIHVLRQPTLPELQARDAKQPYRSQETGSELDQILNTPKLKDDAEFYDKLVVSTEKYKVNVLEGQSEEDRKEALKGIPSLHKQSIINALLKVDSEVVYDSEEDVPSEEAVFVWGDNQTYRVRTEIGNNGQFVLYSEIKEPTQSQIDFYIANKVKYEIEKGGRKPVTRITVSLVPAVELFDSLISSVEGAVFKGSPVDVSNKEQLASISAYWKRSIVDKVMRELELDMGEF